MPHKWDEEEEKRPTMKGRVVEHGLRHKQPAEWIGGSFEVSESYRAPD